MNFDEKKLEKTVNGITLSIQIDEEFGLRYLHMGELNRRLKRFYKNYNSEDNFKIHQQIFKYAVSYLEKRGWTEASLEGEVGYLVTI